MVNVTRQQSPYRWVMLGLCGLTAIGVHAMPSMALSVLFKEIQTEFTLTNFQVGIIWGISSLMSMMLAIVAGIFADYFGTKRVIVVAALGVGTFGAFRAFSTGFFSFLGASVLLGLFLPMVGVTLHTIASNWFSKDQLGLANGVIASGFASGFMLGSYFSARVFSPLLGGWQMVFVMYGSVGIIFGIVWWFIHPKPETPPKPISQEAIRNIGTQLNNIRRYRWLTRLGLGTAGIWACMRGFSGYLPLYLRNQGWEGAAADSALSLFFLMSLIFVIPMSTLSDRLKTRKPFIMLAAVTLGSGVMLAANPTPWIVYAAVVLAGAFFDLFMTISITTATEVRGIGPTIAGVAVGYMFLFNDVGGLIAPPLGNLLSNISPQLPFFFWGALALVGAAVIYSVPNSELTTADS